MLDVKIKKVSFEESIIEVETKSGTKTLTIEKTAVGHAYEDFTDWDISDRQYYDLEELVDSVIDRMRGNSSSLNVSWEE